MTSAEDAGPMSAPATLAGVVGVAGAVVQLGSGFMATAWPHPTITDPPYEVTWAVVNIGMVATVVGLALLVRPRFGRLALAGAALAIAGHLARIMVAVLSAIGLADEGTAADGAIVVSILGMFGGMAILAVATVRGHVLQGWRSWLPSAVVATGAYRPLWSADVLTVLRRNLIEVGIATDKVDYRISQMRETFPGAAVAGYESLIEAMTNDPKDRHVLAAAVRANAEVIVTFNTNDFPEHAKSGGLSMIGRSCWCCVVGREQGGVGSSPPCGVGLRGCDRRESGGSFPGVASGWADGRVSHGSRAGLPLDGVRSHAKDRLNRDRPHGRACLERRQADLGGFGRA